MANKFDPYQARISPTNPNPVFSPDAPTPPMTPISIGEPLYKSYENLGKNIEYSSEQAAKMMYYDMHHEDSLRAQAKLLKDQQALDNVSLEWQKNNRGEQALDPENIKNHQQNLAEMTSRFGSEIKFQTKEAEASYQGSIKALAKGYQNDLHQYIKSQQLELEGHLISSSRLNTEDAIKKTPENAPMYIENHRDNTMLISRGNKALADLEASHLEKVTAGVVKENTIGSEVLSLYGEYKNGTEIQRLSDMLKKASSEEFLKEKGQDIANHVINTITQRLHVAEKVYHTQAAPVFEAALLKVENGYRLTEDDFTGLSDGDRAKLLTTERRTRKQMRVGTGVSGVSNSIGSDEFMKLARNITETQGMGVDPYAILSAQIDDKITPKESNSLMAMRNKLIKDPNYVPAFKLFTEAQSQGVKFDASFIPDFLAKARLNPSEASIIMKDEIKNYKKKTAGNIIDNIGKFFGISSRDDMAESFGGAYIPQQSARDILRQRGIK